MAKQRSRHATSAKPRILLYRLADVPIARHLTALFDAPPALTRAPFFACPRAHEDRVNPIFDVPERALPEEVAKNALSFAETFTVNVVDAAALGLRSDAGMCFGFHSTLSFDEARAAFEKAGLEVLLYRDFVAERSRPFSEAEAMQRAEAFFADSKDPLPMGDRAGRALSGAVERWSDTSDRVLSELQRRAPGAWPSFRVSGASLEGGLDRMGLLAARLVALGRTEAAILGAMARGRLGAPLWPSFDYFLVGKLARIDAVLERVVAEDPAIAPAVVERILTSAKELACIPAVRAAVLALVARGTHASLFTARALAAVLDTCGEDASAFVTREHLRLAEERAEPELAELAARLCRGAPANHGKTPARVAEAALEGEAEGRRRKALVAAAQAEDVETARRTLDRLKESPVEDAGFFLQVLAILVEHAPSLTHSLVVSTLIDLAQRARPTEAQRRQLAQVVFRALFRHPSQFLAHHFDKLRALGAERIPRLIEILEAALASAHVAGEHEYCATRERLEEAARDGWNPASIVMFRYATEALLELARVGDSSVGDAITRSARGWSEAMTWVFAAGARVLAAEKYGDVSGETLRESRQGKALCLAAFEVVPRGDGRVALSKVLVRLGSLPGGEPKPPRSPIPGKLPLEVSEALRLRDKLGVEAALPPGKPITAEGERALVRELGARVPEELRALYRLVDGIGRAELVASGALPDLQHDLETWVKSHLEEAKGEDELGCSEGIDLRLLPVERLLAIGKGAGGDFFVLAPHVRVTGGGLPVLRFVHDELCTVRPHSRSIGEFLAKLVVDAWQRVNVAEDRVERLLRDGGFRVKVDG